MTHLGFIAGNQYDRYVIDDNPKLVHQGISTVQVTAVEYVFGHIRFSMKFESSMFSLDGFSIEAFLVNDKIHFTPPGMITLTDTLFVWLEESYRDVILNLPTMQKKQEDEKTKMDYDYHKRLTEEYEKNQEKK